MIVAVMGTHGAGKSTLVADVAARHQCAPVWESSSPPPRRQPIMMRGDDLTVIGWYTQNHQSGIDSGRFAGRVPEVFGWVAAEAAAGRSVLVEGMLVAGTAGRLIRLHHGGHPVTVVWLDEPLAVCASSVTQRKQRRRTKHSAVVVNVAALASKARSVARAAAKFEVAGVPVRRCGRPEALSTVEAALRRGRHGR